jgi:hypothetical protein
LITAFFYSIFNVVSALQETRTLMVNCGNPEGLTVHPSGRVIEQGETFTVIGYETVDEAGISSVTVYDGTISGEELFICEVKDE